jgi:hypothetical protein
MVHIPASEHKSGRKTGKTIDAFLPSEIAADVALPEYLKYREVFLIGPDGETVLPDHGTLLLNDRGTRLSISSFERLVQDNAFKYGKAPMNPHMFRDAVSDECMIKHPQDSEHVAKGMFQSSDRTMKRSYSARHNASSGANSLNENARSRREGREKEQTLRLKKVLSSNSNLDEYKKQR